MKGVSISIRAYKFPMEVTIEEETKLKVGISSTMRDLLYVGVSFARLKENNNYTTVVTKLTYKNVIFIC